ncbi:hypothetical protein PVAND_010791 [Polypedilum vanderplanki]|uniref:Uncharacterized protein n=1 Tax=Polypedilum vanderplanki TaxID=319348 RepID=A0A9J6CHX4_POLVA|nr:hypothetical protein PVAND_010791 [Polypedilum vanderplanki]
MGQVQGFNLCEAFENRNAQALENIERLIPDKCPIEKVFKCLDGSIKINLSKFKLILIAFRGNKIKYDINIEHENGQTCIKYEFTLVNE